MESADLIVVGASVGGLSAAILAADMGLRTVVLERERDPGGGAAREPEAIAAAGTRFQRVAGVDDAPARLADDLLAATRHHVEPELVEALVAESAPLVEWLADRCDVGIELVTALASDGHSRPRLHVPAEGSGQGLVAGLTRSAGRSNRVAVRTGIQVERLLRDERGAVSGVGARSGRRVEQTIAGPVLLACGGFVADDALVAEHCPDAAALPRSGWAGAVGEGLRFGQTVGAQLRRMRAFLATPLSALPGDLAVTAPLIDMGAILVNQAGHRFADETSESLPLALAVRAQPGRVAYLLFDERIASAARAADPFFGRVVLPRAGRRANSLPELAKQFELDADGLGLAVDTYNANLDLGGDPFGREGAGVPLAPPFHAIRVTGARRRTLGGLAVDSGARVLDAGGQPICGLYATGGAAAGIGGDGTEGLLRGIDTLHALGLARLAVRGLAAARPAE